VLSGSVAAAVARHTDRPVLIVHSQDHGDLIGRIDREYERIEARATIERLTPILDHRSREILRLRFESDLLQSEIAERVGISQMHVSRIIRSSLERLSLYGRAAAFEPAR
jgi:RNA polymerase sigma-B factor